MSRRKLSNYRAGLGLVVFFPVYFVFAGFLGRQYFADRLSGAVVLLAVVVLTPLFIIASALWPKYVPAAVSVALSLISWAFGLYMLTFAL